MTRRRLGRGLVGVGAVGVAATLAGTVLGVVGLARLDATLTDSVVVTADAVDALAATVAVADELVDDTASTLTSAALGARAAAGGTEATVEVLEGAAAVTGGDVADSLAAVEATLPALVDVAGVIDGTLSTLDRLPLGPTYDPEVPFDVALRDVQAELDGLPESLRAQADLLEDGAVELGDVGRSARFIADDLEELAGTLRATGDVLDEVAATTDSAARTLQDDVAALGGGLTAARLLLVVGGLALAVAQAVPAAAGWVLLHPDTARRLLAETPPDG